MDKAPLSSSHKRLGLLIGLGSLAFAVLILRLWQLTILNAPEDTAGKVRQTLQQTRASFVDRRGILLATNVKTFSVYANPSLILDFPDAASKLSRLFPKLSACMWEKRLQSHKRFVWIARHVTPSDKEAVLRLGIPGVGLMEDQRRIWPHGNLFSHVLGFTNVDNHGISGLEKGLNHKLQNQKEAVKLSLDIRIQHIVREELYQTIQTFEAVAGNALLVKVATGELIASVSLPDFNPHLPNKSSAHARFNRNMTGVYEFGSLLKIHNTAMLLDHGLATFNSVFDASIPLQVGRFRITDFKGKLRPLTLREAFLYSSNIANAKMALLAGIEKQKNFFKKMGFCQPVPLETPEKATSLMPATWNEPTLITISYGYGLAVTPLHLVQSVGTLVTGHKRALTLLHCARPVTGKRLIKPETARLIRLLLHEATIHGQASKAASEGYEVGAKTGTCNLRNDRGRYVEKQNMTSCIGAFPIHNPAYILLVTIERPKPNHLTHGYATAGWIAAPAWRRMMTRVAPLLGVFPEKGGMPTDVVVSETGQRDPPLILTIDRLLEHDT